MILTPRPWRRAAPVHIMVCGGRTPPTQHIAITLTPWATRRCAGSEASIHHSRSKFTLMVPHFWVRIFWCTLLIEYYTITWCNSTNFVLNLTLIHFSICAWLWIRLRKWSKCFVCVDSVQLLPQFVSLLSTHFFSCCLLPPTLSPAEPPRAHMLCPRY